MQMTILMGIDPGSRITGYGLVSVQGTRYQHIESGHIKTDTKNLAGQLRQIYLGIEAVVKQYQPHEVAVEEVFFHNNVKSALKLGQARGAAIVAVATTGLSVAEYSPREVKQAVVGYGAASKEQIQHMVKRLLNLQVDLQEDAADALAIAICHGQNRMLKKVYAELAE